MGDFFKPWRRKLGVVTLVVIAIYRCGFLVNSPMVNIPLFWSNLASRKIATVSDVFDAWMLCVFALHSVAPQLIIIKWTFVAAIVWWHLPSEPRLKSSLRSTSSR